MSKKLDINGITSDLEGSAFFPARAIPSAAVPPAGLSELSGQSNQTVPVRPNGRTPERAGARRIITRNSFEIYEDQMDGLRKLAYLEKMDGKIGSMSAMVREAVDQYLRDHPVNK